jgi:hypothetical protein
VTDPPGQADQSAHLQLPQHLEELRLSLDAANPDLYRHLALYLQVLREVLPRCVEQALFHLATEAAPDRYAALPPSRRRKLHRRQASLVQRCCVLLTVEQLACLAARIQRERHSRVRQQRQRLMESLTERQPELPPPPAQAVQPMPLGSVQLGFSLPLSSELFSWDSLDLIPAPLEDPAATAPDRAPEPPLPTPQPSAQHPSAQQPSAEQDDPGNLLEALAELLADDPADASADPAAAGPWDSGTLPRDPLLLLRWLQGFEQALSRRLRNLSHALNVELLRLGLAPALLPVSLLDAVLAGQVETLPAPANLLHLRLPLGMAGPAPPIHALAVLLRCTDLELEQPRLRTCRRRLQQRHHELRRMAEQFRRLQRRLQSHEAQQLWLQDIRPPID